MIFWIVIEAIEELRFACKKFIGGEVGATTSRCAGEELEDAMRRRSSKMDRRRRKRFKDQISDEETRSQRSHEVRSKKREALAERQLIPY